MSMNPSSEIPRPAGSLLAHSLRFARNTMQFYEDAYRECGDIFMTRIPGLGSWVYVCSPELVKAMLEAPATVLSGDIGDFSLAHVLGEGATSEHDGAAYQERRDVTCPYLEAQGSLRQADEIRRITERRVAGWPLDQPFQLVLELQKIALEALIKVVFTAVSDEKARELADLYESFSFKGLRSPAVPHSTLQVDLGPWSPWGRVLKRRREVARAFLAEVDARLAAVDRPEADDLLLAMARARFADGSRYSREVLLTEILVLLFQGHELTGDSLTWTLGELVAHPPVLARLRQELDEVVGPDGVRSTHLPRLPYLEAVVYEGLRLRPSNLLTSLRRVKQPTSLGGYLLPEGTLVAICYPALSMRDDLFPDPHRFDPEHFLGKTFPADVWSAFGGGPRICPGKDLALVILKVALATLVRKAELKIAQSEVRPVRKGYYYEPNKGLLVTLEKRL
jgi:cytochrome P450 family 110